MRMKEMSGDGVQPADLKRMGKADAKVYVHKDGKTILVPASKKDEYMAKGYKLSALRAEDDNSSRGMNKYGLAARNKDGKFYSYRHGKLTGTFDNIKDLQKHQAELIKDESMQEKQSPYYSDKEGAGWLMANKDKIITQLYSGGIQSVLDPDDAVKAISDLIPDVTTKEIVDILKKNGAPFESVDQDTDESGIMYKAGVKKYGKDGMKKIQSAAGKGASAEEIGKIKDQHNKKKKESVQEDLAQMAQKVEQDHEVQMARSDLYKAAKYSIALHEMLKNVSEEQGIEGWVAAKITKASDYLSSVKHYMEYDMMESKAVTEATACNCDENCGCGGNCTSGCNCKPGCDTLDEGWLDSLKQMGYRFADEIKSLNDPALAAKLQADDQADLRTDNMVNDINTVHAMNRTPTDKGYDNETIVGYISKYVMPRHPALHNAGDFLKKMFPPGQNTDKNVLRGQLQKIAQMSQKVDVGQQGQQTQQPQTASIDYKQSMHKKFEAKLKESTKKAVLEDFVGKPISEEEFDRLAEKQDACYHKVKARYKVWPSAYASGALVQCRKKGAANWGNKSKK